MRGLPIMRGFGWPVIFDATHSVQLPGGAGRLPAGSRNLSRRCRGRRWRLGIDGLFVEVHDAPEKALSDGANALRLDRLSALLMRLRILHTV